jgi:hypothetical protein
MGLMFMAMQRHGHLRQLHRLAMLILNLVSSTAVTTPFPAAHVANGQMKLNHEAPRLFGCSSIRKRDRIDVRDQVTNA